MISALATVWACFFFEGQSFLAWPAYLEDQQYKVLSTFASANPIVAARAFRDLLESTKKDTKSVASCRHKARLHEYNGESLCKCRLATILHDDLG